MKTTGRQRSANVVDRRGTQMNNFERFLNESLRMARKVQTPKRRPALGPKTISTRPKNGKK